jgi:NAD(P) transhydrogenase
MSNAHFDLLVIGSGPAGQHAALKAAAYGKRTAIVERKPRIGGAGLQTGTIPSKSLREVAYLASRYGLQGMREAVASLAHWPMHGLLAEANRRKSQLISQQEAVTLNTLMAQGIDIMAGEAVFEDPHTVRIHSDNKPSYSIHADTIVLATGSRPRRPSDVPFDKKTVLDSTSILKLRHLPSSLLVVGGGVIACEFCTIFAALGVEVSLVDSHHQILAYLSEDVVQVLMDTMQDFGVQLHLNQRVESIAREQGRVITTSETGQQWTTDTLLYAQGREPNCQHLQPERADLQVDQHGWIHVDQNYCTNQPHIYAVGDLIGRPALAATGMEQGRLAVQHAVCGISPDHSRIMPMAIYTIPELSWVGKTEKELRAEGVDYVVGKGLFQESARGQIIGDNGGFLKLNVARASGKILGVHIIGESASELIHIGQLLMNLHGSVYDLLEQVFNYPTLAECYKIAARACVQQLTNSA